MKSKHLLLILWVFGIFWVCRVTLEEFVCAPLVAGNDIHAAVLHDKTKLPLACCVFTQVHFNPCHFPGEWDPASFQFLSIEPLATSASTVKSINWIPTSSCRSIMNWAKMEVLAGPRLPMFLVLLLLHRKLGYNEWPPI